MLVSTVKGQSWKFTIEGMTVFDSELYVLRVGRKTTDIAVFDLSAFKCVSVSLSGHEGHFKFR